MEVLKLAKKVYKVFDLIRIGQSVGKQPVVPDVWATLRGLRINKPTRRTKGGSHRLSVVQNDHGHSMQEDSTHVNNSTSNKLLIPTVWKYRACTTIKERIISQPLNLIHIQPNACDYDLNKAKYLRAGLLNCQSARNKADLLRDITIEKDIDILCLTETWIKSGDIDKRTIKDITPPGYSFLHNPRISASVGGGVAVLHKDSLLFKQTSVSVKAKSFEHIEGYMPFNSTCIRIILLYRVPPSQKNKIKQGDFLAEFTSLLEIVSTLPGKLFILGDFNIQWGNDRNTEFGKFKQLLDMFNLEQNVTEFTHVNGHILDHVITAANDNLVRDVSIHDMISDHCLIISDLTVCKPPNKRTTHSFRKLRSLKLETLCTDISKSTLITTPAEEPDALAQQFNSTLAEILNNHAPLITRPLPNKPLMPWFNESIKQEKMKKRKLEKQWRKSKLEIHKQIFKTQRNHVCHLICEAKKAYFTDSITQCNGDQKKLFSLVNRLLHHKDHHKLPLGSVSELLGSFGNFFVKKIENIRANICLDRNVRVIKSSVTKSKSNTTLDAFDKADENEIKKIILNANNSTCQLDPIPTSVLKQSLDILLPVITKLINSSLSSGIVPRSFKHALVKPLLKKSTLDTEELKNYRPISNIPFIAKVLEKVVANRLCTYMTENNLQEIYQSAYKPNHSTETALLRVCNDILLKLDTKQCTILVLLDLSAAFDTIDHTILLQRLAETLGIKKNALAWFDSYLHNRSNAICIDTKFSEQSDIQYGVPQGSVLGPILFTIYMMPLANVLKSFGISYHFYADDTQIYLSFDPSDPSSLHNTLNTVELCVCEIKQWMATNMLKLNDDKTEVLFIASTYYRKMIEVERSARNIGVIFYDSLSLF